MRVLFIVLLLVGCGGGSEGENNHGYGFQYDVLGLPQGLKLRYAGIVTPSDPLANPFFYQDIQTQVETCSGMSAGAPFVILMAAGSLGPEGGHYWSDPSLILVEAGDPHFVEHFFQHELVHYLLDVNTGDLDPNHHSRLFIDCT